MAKNKKKSSSLSGKNVKSSQIKKSSENLPQSEIKASPTSDHNITDKQATDSISRSSDNEAASSTKNEILEPLKPSVSEPMAEPELAILVLDIKLSMDDSIVVKKILEPDELHTEQQLDQTTNVDTIELSTIKGTDQVSIASTDAVHETFQDDLNTLNTNKEELTEQQLNPELAKFITACQEGNLTIVKQLISSKLVSANDTFSDSITGLHWACINNRLSIVKYLLSNEYSTANPNAIGGDLKATPLHWAARNGLVYIVDYLLTNSNADPALKDNQNYNALHLSVHSSNITMVTYILLTCCDPNYKHHLYIDEPDSCNRTSLHWAAYQGDILSVNALLKFGADVSKVDNTLFLPIHWAFMKGYKSVLKSLLRAGSDIHAKNDHGKNTFDIAKDMNCYGTWVKVLTEDGRDPKNDWAVKSNKIEPKLGKLITFFTPYLLLPAVFQICSFGSGFFVPKTFFASVLVVGVVFITNRLVVPTYLIDDRPLQKSPFLAGIFSGTAFWCIMVFLYNIVPALSFSQFFTNILMSATISVFTWAFFKTMFINPGFVPVPTDNEIVLDQVKDLIKSGEFDTDHFCVNSFVRKPLRSKYSKANGRLVARFDHYCPWVYNEIGVRNHKLFITFVYALNFSIVLFTYLSIKFMDKYEDGNDSDDEQSCFILSDELCYGFRNHHFHFNLLMWCLLQGIWITFLTVVQTFQILKGMTTWEFSTMNKKIPRSNKLNHSTLPRDFSDTGSPMTTVEEFMTPARSEFSTCMNVIGLDQFIMTTKLSIASIFPSRSSDNGSGYSAVNNIDIPTDYGFKQNWLDFWVLGEIKWRNIFYLPIEGENNLNGQVVDYYKLYKYPAKNALQIV
jgi:palmitoyltransferase